MALDRGALFRGQVLGLAQVLAEAGDRLVGIAEVLVAAGDVVQVGRVKSLGVQAGIDLQRLAVAPGGEVRARLHLGVVFFGSACASGKHQARQQRRDRDREQAVLREVAAGRDHWHWKLTQLPLQQTLGLVDAQLMPTVRQVWQVPFWHELPDVHCALPVQLDGHPVAVPLQL